MFSQCLTLLTLPNWRRRRGSTGAACRRHSSAKHVSRQRPCTKASSQPSSSSWRSRAWTYFRHQQVSRTTNGAAFGWSSCWDSLAVMKHTQQTKSFERFGSQTRLSRSRVFRSRPACPQLREQISFFLHRHLRCSPNFCWWLAAPCRAWPCLALGISHPVFPTCLAEVGHHDRAEAPDLFRNLTFSGFLAVHSARGSAVTPPGQGSGSAADPAKARD